MEQEQKLREAFKRAAEEGGGKRGDELLAQKGIKRNMTEQQIYDAFLKPSKGKS